MCRSDRWGLIPYWCNDLLIEFASKYWCIFAETVCSCSRNIRSPVTFLPADERAPAVTGRKNIGVLAACCARAASGHAAIAPPAA